MNFSKRKNNINTKLVCERKNSLSLSGRSSIFDWIILLLVSFVFLIILFLWSLGLFMEVNSGNYFSIQSQILEKEEIINEEKMENIVEEFNQKKEIFNSLTNGMILSSGIRDVNKTESKNSEDFDKSEIEEVEIEE